MSKKDILTDLVATSNSYTVLDFKSLDYWLNHAIEGEDITISGFCAVNPLTGDKLFDVKCYPELINIILIKLTNDGVLLNPEEV